MSNKNIPPSTPPYEEVILIDCSRSNSEEKKGGNNTNKSIFTNKLGSGVKLNPGDKVSVHQGFISDRGCGGSVIEFTGQNLNKEYSVQQTIVTNNAPDTLGFNPLNEYPFGSYPPADSLAQTYKTETKTFQLSDNEINIGISYYKSSNGEGYFHLPRRYDAIKQPFWYSNENGSGHGLVNSNLQDWARLLLCSTTTGSAPPNQDPLAIMGATYPWMTLGIQAQFYDNYANGMSMPPYFSENLAQYNLPDIFTKGQICWDDKYFYDSGNLPTQKEEFPNLKGGSIIEKAKIDWHSNNANVGILPHQYYRKTEFINRCLKSKNDGSRYTLYNCVNVYRGIYDPATIRLPLVETTGINRHMFRTTLTSGIPITSPAPESKLYPFKAHPREPSMNEFIKYQEIKNLKVPKGYDAPSNVSEALTNQLNTTQDEKSINMATGGSIPIWTNPVFPGGNDGRNTQRDISGISVNSATYKPFNCSTSVTFQPISWAVYNDPAYQYGNEKELNPVSTADPPPVIVPSIHMADMMNSHETIGFKRPELIDAGRTMMKELGGIWDYDTADSSGVYTMKRLNKVGDLDADMVANKTLKNLSFAQMIYPCIAEDIAFGDSIDADIKTSIPWTDENLKLMKTYFDTQGGYKELFESMPMLAEQTNASTYADYYIKPDGSNCRFFHMNPHVNEFAYDFDQTTKRYSLKATTNKISPWMSVLGDDGNDRDNKQFNSQTADLGTNMKRVEADQDYIPYSGGAESAHESPNLGTYTNSQIIPFYYDESRKDILSGGANQNDLWGGLFKKVKVVGSRLPLLMKSDSVEDTFEYYAIAVCTENINGINEEFFKYPQADGDNYLEKYRGIGYDMHFNAFGNSSLCLYAGYLDSLVNKATDNTTTKLGAKFQANAQDENGTTRQEWIFQNWRQYYVGADSPLIAFDDKSSRFSFQQLYTAEQIGNPPSAGADLNHPTIDDADNKVYKVNKNLLGTNYAPDMRPYMDELVPADNSDAKKTPAESFSNLNIFPFSIIDSHGGIFLENMGVSEDKWDDSLWGILGFTYNQFNNAKTLSRQTRINDIVTIDNIGKPTTNANIVPSTLNEWVTNELGTPLYTSQIPPSFLASATTGVPTAMKDKGYIRIKYTSVSVVQTSAQINAERLPRKMIRPYFLIKSDIIDSVNYVGGADSGTSLPVIYVINKENAFGDYFFEANEGIQFTITNPRTITSITTSVHDPDMTLANLTDDSAIIYKITKLNRANLMPFAQIMAESQQKK
tara:strand:- start:182 stop:3940 length:3759 start_codon:yes stop_codon:yes gene_type:complete